MTLETPTHGEVHERIATTLSAIIHVLVHKGIVTDEEFDRIRAQYTTYIDQLLMERKNQREETP